VARTDLQCTRRLFLSAAVALLVSGHVLSAGESANAVPLRLEARIPFVSGSVNGGGPCTFIVDTGATETVITPRKAKQLKITAVPVSPRQKVGRVRSLSVGKAAVRGFEVFVFDPVQALPLRLDRGIDYHGILGYTFLSRFITTLDYHAKRLTLVSVYRRSRQSFAASTGDAVRVPFKLVGRLIHVKAGINGAAELPFLVDTGSAEVLLLPGTAAKLGIKGAALPKHPDARVAQLERVTVGEAQCEGVSAIIHTLPQDPRPTYAGILGTPFLSKFVVTINYRDRVILLRSR